MASDKNSWVDRYTLRYGPGSIFGAMIALYIYHELPKEAQAQIPNLGTVEAGTILGLLGIFICYIASAPIVVYHTARRFLVARGKSGKNMLYQVLLYSVGFGLGYTFLPWNSHDITVSLLSTFGMVSAVLWMDQIYQLTLVYLKRDEMFKFYDNLSAARKHRDNGIVESYRTMREHGNAYFVIILEFCFASLVTTLFHLPIGSLDSHAVFVYMLWLVAMWVSPAAVVFYIASRIESDFCDKPPEVPLPVPTAPAVTPAANTPAELDASADGD